MNTRRFLLYTAFIISLLGLYNCAGLYTWSQLERGDDKNDAVIVSAGSNIWICEVDGEVLSGFRKVKLKPGHHEIGVVYRSTEVNGNLKTTHSGGIKHFVINGKKGDYYSIINIDKYSWNPILLSPPEKKDNPALTLVDAASQGNAEMVSEKLRNGADINQKVGHGTTALMISALKGHLKVVQYLLAKDADVNAKDDDGYTALMYAAWKGNIDIIKELISMGAEVNYKAPDGMTALSYASKEGHSKAVEILSYNANSDSKKQAIYGSIVDSRDGRTYKTVQIGGQTWMAENLAFKPSSGNYWAYYNDSANVAILGYLYDWETAKNVCPAGWHLPSDEEWTELLDYLGGDGILVDKLKESLSPFSWVSSKSVLKNETGFSALPGGLYFSDIDIFSGKGSYGLWWSATELSADYAWCRQLTGKADRTINNRRYGLSVRCLKD